MKLQFLALALLVTLGIASRDARAALGEPVQTANTNWWWYYGQTPDKVSSLIAANNARFVSLRVESTSPLLFDVALVQNTGTYEKTWWWYYGLTAQELQDRVTANDARIVNLEPYLVNGTTYFAAIMLHNVGADYSGWWWYYGVSPAQIASYLTQNDARLIDLRQYSNGISAVYGVVMVPNLGANQSGWWWYYRITPAQIAQYASQNNAYLVSLDPANANGTKFNVVMNAYSLGFRWWWYYGQTAAQMASLIQSNNARIFDVKSYVVGGTQALRRAACSAIRGTRRSRRKASCDSDVVSGWQIELAGGRPRLRPPRSRHTTAPMKALMQKYSVPGGAVAVMRNGKLVLARGYGFADNGNSVIAHPDSLFRIASLSKQISSAAILQLVQEGKLSLDRQNLSRCSASRRTRTGTRPPPFRP